MTWPMRMAAFGGRVVLGLVFLLPGVMAARDWRDRRIGTFEFDAPLSEVFVPLLIGAEILAGAALVLGYRSRFAALVLILLLIFETSQQFGMTGGHGRLLVESSDLLLARLGLMGGLLFVFGSGGGPLRLSRR
ncbi:MAG: DoxX family membrane protein [Alphaproteobacteria bacterium]|nr:MAG: DoxX family membrane protein [Alphaproteobacteria bacterium]